jgi:hypothetical protein
MDNTQLDNTRFKDLCTALQGAFDIESFDRLLRLRLNRIRGNIVQNCGLQNVVFQVASAAEREQWLVELARAAYAERPQNDALKRICASLPCGDGGESVEVQGSGRLAESARLVRDYWWQFDSVEMRKHRARLARMLLDLAPQRDIAGSWPPLELLEDLGYLTRRGAVDRGVVWNSFHWYVERYFHRAAPRIMDARKAHRSPRLYRELEWMAVELGKVEEQESGCPLQPLSEGDVRAFLEDEAGLDAESVP